MCFAFIITRNVENATIVIINSISFNFCIVLGMLYVFGRNNHGQLATGDTDERHSPHPVDNFIGMFVKSSVFCFVVSFCAVVLVDVRSIVFSSPTSFRVHY